MNPPGSSKHLFTLQIPAIPSHPGGEIAVTEPSPQIYVLTISSPPDNRLTPPLCRTFLDALDLLEATVSLSKGGVLITTSALPKFYSNGLDLDLALRTPNFTTECLYPLFLRFLTYPMPTIALLNGHTFAGGLMLAMHHDYRFFVGTRGFLCLNEIEFGAPLLPPMAGIFRLRLGSTEAGDILRTTALEAKRWTPEEATRAGFVDVHVKQETQGQEGQGLQAVLQFIQERKLTEKAKKGVYGMIKEELYREQVVLLRARGKDAMEFTHYLEAEKGRKKELERRAKDVRKRAKL